MPASGLSPNVKIILNKNSQFTQEQNIALSKQPNTKTPEQLVTENIKLVHCIIEREFSKYYRHVGIPRDQLLSAGFLGLVVAANKSKYGTFIRYASFWIRYYIYKEVRESFFIKRQYSYCAKLNKIRREQARYTNKNGKEPTFAELAELTGFKEEEVIDVINFDKNNATSTVSLEAFAEDPENANKLDAIIESECEVFDTSQIDYNDLKILIRHVCNAEEQRVMIGYYFDHRTFADIGREIGKSSASLKHMSDRCIEKIKEHVAREKRFHELTGLPTNQAPVNRNPKWSNCEEGK